MEDLLFVLRDERRDHDRALASGENTAVLVIAEGLVVAVFNGIFDPHTADVNGAVVVVLEKGDVAHGAVGAAGDVDVGLDAEEAGFEALGGEAHGVHLDVADHGLELVLGEERAEKGTFPFPALFRSDMRGYFALYALDALQETAHHHCDAFGHGLGDVDDGV